MEMCEEGCGYLPLPPQKKQERAPNDTEHQSAEEQATGLTEAVTLTVRKIVFGPGKK